MKQMDTTCLCRDKRLWSQGRLDRLAVNRTVLFINDLASLCNFRLTIGIVVALEEDHIGTVSIRAEVVNLLERD